MPDEIYIRKVSEGNNKAPRLYYDQPLDFLPSTKYISESKHNKEIVEVLDKIMSAIMEKETESGVIEMNLEQVQITGSDTGNVFKGFKIKSETIQSVINSIKEDYSNE